MLDLDPTRVGPEPRDAATLVVVRDKISASNTPLIKTPVVIAASLTLCTKDRLMNP